ncbi:hydroxyacid dehydrogenase [Vagococcus sp. BWB3-3]|uniref:Hydroxyacid dehydrogenase n=1 Tax=Vagococcus allomyrinae TaxID=2794353 RepID=A0A940SR10_9ENTE|nr:four-carbon acid sugar kinase family protein [Vagococcus allomyrinae]MBP1040287.1 hydroxyacid dehydrogenase [Vagococcus allomyrinae]
MVNREREDHYTRSKKGHNSEIEAAYHKGLAEFSGKIIVLDDDPTGTQTVHSVIVYTDWLKETIRKGFNNESSIFYILTNSRSFSENKTKQVHQEIAQNISEVSKELNQSFTIISRGDSTLRGHYPLETMTLREEIEKDNETKIDGEILCFSFFEGERYTFDNNHYLKKNGEYIPISQTEFANDPTFGFKSSNLIEYIAEKSHQPIDAQDILTIPLEYLREYRVDLIEKILLSSHGFQKIIINSTNYEELKVFVTALFNVMKKGKNYLFRTAASFPKVLAGIPDIDYLDRDTIVDKTNSNGGLIVIGSHVKLSTRQLSQLKASKLPLAFIEFKVATYFDDPLFEMEVTRVKKFVQESIASGVSTVVYTSRELLKPDLFDEESALSMSVNISSSLTKIVELLTIKPKYIISKGGITSSDIATIGLKMTEGTVLGQVTAGIPVWLADINSKFPKMPYLIFPGNVGTVDTLRNVVEKLEGEFS